MTENDDDAPWRAKGVRGVTPPGRRFSREDGGRSAPWQATGVRGVQIQKPESSEQPPSRRWAMAHASRPERPKRKHLSGGPAQKKEPPRKKETSQQDETSLKMILDEVAEFFRKFGGSHKAEVSLSEVITQSQAPYEIIVAFTGLSTLVGQDYEKRELYTFALERGARAYFNLAMRLDDALKAPRGLMPHKLDALFYDLPATAFQLPGAFVADTFGKLSELLVDDVDYNHELFTAVRSLYEKHIEGKSYGDEALTSIFPFAHPNWAPEKEND
ncbi:MAG: hypothetical protein VYC39_06940 [Myxococcota bacterium]|nr:hypothetical protein [Myxococcota bacterium]